ncbi:Methionine aminopeptidase 1, mitochondrial [Oligella ureolytica]
MHEDPQILHYGEPGTGQTLVKGMVFTIEPMLIQASTTPHYLVIEWTVVQRPWYFICQWEHQLIVTDDGYEVLSTSPGMPEPQPSNSSWNSPQRALNLKISFYAVNTIKQLSFTNAIEADLMSC